MYCYWRERTIFQQSRSPKGASRGDLVAERAAAPRMRSSVSAFSGGPRSPSAGTKTGCLQWLHGDRRTGENPGKGAAYERSAGSTEVTVPGTETPRAGARKALRYYQPGLR